MASPSAGSKSRNLRTRVLTAVVLGPAVLAVTVAGGALFHVLIQATAALSAREWVRLVGAGRARFALESTIAFLIASLLAFAFAGWVNGLAVLGLSTGLLLVMLRARGGRDIRMMALGLPYIGLACMALLWLRAQPDIGLGLLIWLLLTVWATDIFGYAVGRICGGPKLAPTISPNKTWSGLAGAVAGAALLGYAAALVWGAAQPALAAPIGALLAVVAQSGDLFESAIKRRYGAKDSGGLIPGHGGLLDRIDGLIAAALVLAVLQLAWRGASPWW